jgi:putative zinc finger protein
MDQHFDAERLAAFADGSLSAAERAAAEAHAADCAQCLQLLAAMARTHEEAPRPSRAAWRLPSFVRWAAPITAVATALALWFNVSRQPRQEPVPTEQARTNAAPSIADEPSSKDRAQEPSQVADVRKPDQKSGQRIGANERKESSPPQARDENREAFSSLDKQAKAKSPAEVSARRDAAKRELETPSPQAAEETLAGAAIAPATTPPVPPAAASQRAGAGGKPAAAPAPASVAETVAIDRAAANKPTDATALRQRQFGAAAIEASAPDRRYRWRVNGVVVERTTDGGATWASLSGMPGAQVLAIASPSANVAWFVGRAGTVFVFSEGAWTRITFPESIDLTSVHAVSGREAQVTALDGRVFRTADGGQTWSMQEIPPLPF